jgi:hypothetical protein
MDKIVFIQAFANKKAGESLECDRGLASQLVHQDKVAVYEKNYDKKLIVKEPHETAVQHEAFLKLEGEKAKELLEDGLIEETKPSK